MCFVQYRNRNIRHNKWDIITIKDFRDRQISADILIFDESQRLGLQQVRQIICCEKIIIFSHDVKQRLNKLSNAEDVVNYIENIANEYKYKLTNKIRTNKEIASFIRKFFNLQRIGSDEMKEIDYKNISLHYTNNLIDAENYINYCRKNGWEYIHLTPSKHKTDKLHNITFSSILSAHQAIGQEFDSVVVAITTDFYYDNNKKLNYKDRSYHYNPLETLFQAVTRTRNKLKIVIINNPEVYSRCIEIILRDIKNI